MAAQTASSLGSLSTTHEPQQAPRANPQTATAAPPPQVREPPQTEAVVVTSGAKTHNMFDEMHALRRRSQHTQSQMHSGTARHKSRHGVARRSHADLSNGYSSSESSPVARHHWKHKPPEAASHERCKAALRKYAWAFEVEHGRPPHTDDDWQPMQRTRALVEGTSATPAQGLQPQPGAAASTAAVPAIAFNAAAFAAATAFMALRKTPAPPQARPDSLQRGTAPCASSPQSSQALWMHKEEEVNRLAFEAEARRLAWERLGAVGRLRSRMRAFFERSDVELGVLCVVLLYGLFVFVDLGIGDMAPDGWRNTGALVIDGAFLVFFLGELLLKIVAWGPRSYFASALNLIDGAAIVLCAALFVAIDLRGVNDPEGDDDGADDAAATGNDELDGEVGGGDNLGAFLVLLRFVRVFRLAAVMLRSLSKSQTVVLDNGSKMHGAAVFSFRFADPADGEKSGEEDTAAEEIEQLYEKFLPGYRGSRSAKRWEEKRQKKAAAGGDAAAKLSTKTEAFLASAAPEVVHLLTADVATLLDLFRMLDRSGDGVLSKDELMPGLCQLGLPHEQSERLYDALDSSGDGEVCVAEIFRAADYLRRTHRAPHPSSPTPRAVSSRESAAPSLSTRLVEAVRHRLDVLREKLTEGYTWWSKERWSVSNDLQAAIGRHHAGYAEVAGAGNGAEGIVLTLPPRYVCEAGKVSLSEHCNGSAALLEDRIEQLLALLDVAQADAGALALKLLEIEIGQPREAARHKEELTTYKTYLMGVDRALPSARLRLQPFLNDSVDGGGWHALRQGDALERKVTRNATCMTIGLAVSLLVRLVFTAAIHLHLYGAKSAIEQLLACEQLFAINTTTAHIPNVFTDDESAAWTIYSTPGNENTSNDAELLSHFTASSCDGSDELLQPMLAAWIGPLLSTLTMVAFSMQLFRGNSNPTALKQLLNDPRVSLILLQAITRAGLVTSNMTHFPVGLRLFSVPGVGMSLFLAKLLDCLFLLCAIVVFVMMDSIIFAAPRMRCVLALTLLFHMIESVLISQFSDLPTVYEVRNDHIGAVIVSLETGLLMMMLGSIIFSILSPRELTFVKLPTGLSDLVLFEAGAHEMQRKERERAKEGFKEAEHEKRKLRRSDTFSLSHSLSV